MSKNNKLTKNLIYLLVGAIFIYGLGVAFSGDIGGDLFTFSDGEEFKKGLFATDSLNKVAESWIAWEISYTDGTQETGRTEKNNDSIASFDVTIDEDAKMIFTDTNFECNSSQDKFLADGVTPNPDFVSCVEQLSLVKSVAEPKIIQRVDFIVYTDFSRIGNEICVGTPATNIQQTVLLNDREINVPKQKIVYNELDERNILKGIGVRITPQFFEGQILIEKGQPLISGDRISVILDVSGRFDIEEANSDGSCPTNFSARHDGFIEGLHAEYDIIYADPLDLLLGTFPETQQEIDDPKTVEQCVNGKCGTVIISTPSCRTGEIYDLEEFKCVKIENVNVIEADCRPPAVINENNECEEIFCTQEVDPVCSDTGVTYNNICIANSFGATIVSGGICESDPDFVSEPPTTTDNNPDGTNGIVGICDNEGFDCSEDSEDINNYIEQVRVDEFRFNSFEFIMLIIIGIIIVVVILSRITKK